MNIISLSRRVSLPTAITMSRVVLLPLFLVMFLRGDAVGYAVCYGVLALCEASDALDGAVARRRNETSPLGMLLDPLADTITRFCMFLALLSVGLLPLWMAVVLFARDISVAYLRSFAVCRGIVISARWSGKVKAGVQAAALLLTCVGLLFQSRHAYTGNGTAGWVLLASSAVGLLGPVIVALVLRLDRGTVLRLCGFALLLLVPVAALFFTTGPLPQIQWLVTLSFWVATLVTLFSFYDYMSGFLGQMAAAGRRADARGK